MGYKLCPICQLNMIEEGDSSCAICKCTTPSLSGKKSTNSIKRTPGRQTYANFFRKDPNRITKGDVLSNEEICAYFGCSPQGGMRKSNTTNTLILINDHSSIYNDCWQNGICLYTGMGLEGDQNFHFRQNLTLLNSKYSSVKVHLFERAYSHYTYIGRVELAAEPYYDQQRDISGKQRRVCIFPLKVID